MIDIWTLYDDPTDPRARWVVRLWKNDKPTDVFFASNSRDACEEFVLDRHPGAYWMPPSPEDGPTIAGTWI